MDIFLADESVDYQIISALIKRGFIVQPIIDISPGLSDNDVLAYCMKNDFILITEDKDFGELTIRFKKSNHGIVLLRLMGLDKKDKTELVIEAF